MQNKRNSLWKSIGGQAKEIFFPTRCFICKRYGDLLCADCQTLFDISRVHRPDRNHKYLADIFAACGYENKYVQKMIRGLKYEPFRKELACPLAELIAGHFKLAEQNFNLREFVIVPVPLAEKRLRWRGFNQADIIARELGRLLDAPVAGNCLARVLETKNQADLGQAERLTNIKEAFACANNAPFKNKPVLIVDDVITTGATINECARVLSRAGAAKVIGVAIARTNS
ncbi:MAG: ComF family protein [Candidatus Nealsonbacteria bacterium DGGOD1a]|nr:MAG: ComF family protein [Candidatus Nealsonbacteria bacterium DGGOD1a]